MTSSPGTSLRNADERHLSQSPRDKAVRELERHGYVPEPYSLEQPGEALCRHPVAPSLMVHDDGRIELPPGQIVTQPLAPTKRRRHGVHWGRATLFAVLLCIAIFMGLLLTALIVG